MDEEIRYRGKTFTAREIDEINEVIATNRERSRMFISQEICRRWGWRQPNGVLKDMICRGLLLRLEAQGLIEVSDQPDFFEGFEDRGLGVERSAAWLLGFCLAEPFKLFE